MSGLITNNKMTPKEIFICKMWCGGIPKDILWATDNKAFKIRLEKFKNGDYAVLWKNSEEYKRTLKK